MPKFLYINRILVLSCSLRNNVLGIVHRYFSRYFICNKSKSNKYKGKKTTTFCLFFSVLAYIFLHQQCVVLSCSLVKNNVLGDNRHFCNTYRKNYRVSLLENVVINHSILVKLCPKNEKKIPATFFKIKTNSELSRFFGHNWTKIEWIEFPKNENSTLFFSNTSA